MKFKIVEEKEQKAVIELIANCTAKLLDDKIEQWDDTYPSSELISLDISAKSIEGIYLNNILLGVYVLDQAQSSQYAALTWNLNEAPIGVVHRMAVDPNSQGIGLGAKLLKHAEEKALNLGYKSIRLDAYKNNADLLKFYEKRGYTEVGEIPLEYTAGPFVCFEKKL
jgi:GNAT superfamily N-acetyltransferase